MENTIVVGIGEALWDVLPEGKKLVELRLTLHITYHSLVWTAVQLVP